MSSAIADAVKVAQRFSTGIAAGKGLLVRETETEIFTEPRTVVSRSENQLECLTRSLSFAVLYISPASRALVEFAA